MRDIRERRLGDIAITVLVVAGAFFAVSPMQSYFVTPVFASHFPEPNPDDPSCGFKYFATARENRLAYFTGTKGDIWIDPDWFWGCQPNRFMATGMLIVEDFLNLWIQVGYKKGCDIDHQDPCDAIHPQNDVTLFGDACVVGDCPGGIGYLWWEFEQYTSVNTWRPARIEITGEGWFGHFWELCISVYCEEIEVIKSDWDILFVQMEVWGDGGVNDIHIHDKNLQHRHKLGGEAYWKNWHNTFIDRQDDGYAIWLVSQREVEGVG